MKREGLAAGINYQSPTSNFPLPTSKDNAGYCGSEVWELGIGRWPLDVFLITLLVLATPANFLTGAIPLVPTARAGCANVMAAIKSVCRFQHIPVQIAGKRRHA